jgi:O-antigen/teichoic acid export membrane protein
LGQVLYYGGAMLLVAIAQATAPRIAVLRVLAMTLSLALVFPTWLKLTSLSPARGEITRRLLRFSFPLLIASISWVALQRSDVIMLGFMRGTRAVGLYSPVLYAVDLCTVIMSVMATYYLPLASGLVGKGDLPALRSLYSTVTKWGVVLAVPLLSALIVAPGPLLRAVFGPLYGTTEASLIARILAVGYAVTVATGQNAYSLVALGKSRAIGVRSVIALVGNLAINAVLIPLFGPVGAAIGTSTVYVGLNVANSYLIWKIAHLHPLRRDFVCVVGTAVALALLSLTLVSLLDWSQSLAAPLFTASTVGVGSFLAWVVTSSTEERHSWALAFRRRTVRQSRGA